jgi:hypothetical protein
MLRSIVWIVWCAGVFGSTVSEASETNAAGSGAVMAQSDAEPVGMTREAAQADYRHRLTCKPESVIGTRIPKTVCRTKAQSDAQSKASAEYLEQIQLESSRGRRKY